MPTRCTATTRAGAPCKAWAVRGSTPPRCTAHGGTRGPADAPGEGQRGDLDAEARAYAQPALFETAPARGTGPGGREREPVSLDARIADLNARIEELSAYIDAVGPTLSRSAWLQLLDVHSRLNARLGRLMRDRDQVRAQGPSDELARAMDEALDALGKEWDMEL